MNSPGFYFALFICFMMTHGTFAQQYFVKTYTIENGLPTRSVSDVCQDTNGTMWFATYSGISSFDGFSFTNYSDEQGLPLQHYTRVKMDALGKIWAVPCGMADTIAYFEYGIWKKIAPASDNGGLEVSSFDLLVREGQTVLCVGSGEGLEIYQNGQWHHLDVSTNPKLKATFSVIAEHGKFYVLTRMGIYMVYQEKTGWIVKEFLKSQDAPILAFKFENPGKPDEKLWMINAHQLTFLQNGKINHFSDDFFLLDPNSLGRAFLNMDHRGNIFFGNNLAKYFVNQGSGQSAPLMVSNGFSSDGASSVFIDREENVWFSDTRGVDKISNLFLRNYFESNGLHDNEVTAILELADGRMVFGHNKGLTIFDHGIIQKVGFPSSENIQARVMDLMQDDQGNMWIAAGRMGVGKMTKDGKFKWYNLDSTFHAVTVLQDAKGKIWVGSNQELFYLKNEKLVPYEHNHNIRSPFRKLFSNTNGEIIGSGLYGFFILSGDNVKIVPMEDAIKSKSTYFYYRSNSGTEYVGTTNGLCVLDNGRIRKFNQNGIRIESPVYFIFEDGKHNLWVGSNNGLYKWDGKNSLETFSLQNGLAGSETNRSAGMVDSQGNIWIGTDKGLSCILNGYIETKPTIPLVRLVSIEDNKSVFHSFVDNCSIGFNDNTLFFHFRGISFVNEDLITYRYKLDGFDSDWQLVNQSNLGKVKYAGLEPGKYQFSVQARNGSGAWSEVAKSGMITIRTPLYREWWFHLLLFIGISLIIFGVIKILLQRKYYHKLEKEIAERKSSQLETMQTLQSLHASELKYRDLIEFAVDGFLMGTKDGKIIGANSYMQNLTGRGAEGLIGLHISQLFGNDHLNNFPLRFDLLEQGEVVVSHRNIQRPDGTLIPVEMHTKMMPDGTYQSIFHDITNRLKSEEELRESRELHKLISDKMTDVVWLMDLTGKSTFVSPSIEHFTGFTVDEYMQQTITNRFTPGSVAVAKQLFGNELPKLTAHPEKLHGYSNTQRMEYICKTGGTKWGELLMTPYFGASGEWLGIHGVTRDITDRKLAEEAFRNKALELERFNSLMIGREIKMIELKKEINELLVKANEPEKYTVHEI
jgi:PAS domain S-box-containing protein